MEEKLAFKIAFTTVIASILGVDPSAMEILSLTAVNQRRLHLDPDILTLPNIGRRVYLQALGVSIVFTVMTSSAADIMNTALKSNTAVINDYLVHSGFSGSSAGVAIVKIFVADITLAPTRLPVSASTKLNCQALLSTFIASFAIIFYLH